MAEQLDISVATTNRQARAALGVAADYLRQGFEIAKTLTGTAGVRKNAQDLLSRTNGYAVKVYGQIPNNDEPLSPALRKQVLTAIKQSAENLKLVSTAQNDLRGSFLRDVLSALATATKAVAMAAVEAAGGGIKGGFVVAGSVLGLAAVFLLFKKR